MSRQMKCKWDRQMERMQQATYNIMQSEMGNALLMTRSNVFGKELGVDMDIIYYIFTMDPEGACMDNYRIL